nr:Uncharacterised protein [Salmonella sp. NCTC 7297]
MKLGTEVYALNVKIDYKSANIFIPLVLFLIYKKYQTDVVPSMLSVYFVQWAVLFLDN